MGSKFEKVSLKVNFEDVDVWQNLIFKIRGQFRQIFSEWVFYIGDSYLTFKEDIIEQYPHRFEVVRKPRKIKSVVMKESKLWRADDKWDYNGSFNEDYILNNPDKFIIEYED